MSGFASWLRKGLGIEDGLFGINRRPGRKGLFGIDRKGEQANRLSSEDELTRIEAKLDKLTGSDKSGFVTPSSKSKRVNLSSARVAKLTRAQQEQALGFNVPDVNRARQIVASSNNPIVQAAIQSVGGRSAAGPRTRLDNTAISPPKVRPRPPKVRRR